ncbi:MAG: ThuA domain-containing protein [Lewinellaceae bacterium]|nr:ThuA domain-containing protein [Lewinellaceae bacterium]
MRLLPGIFLFLLFAFATIFPNCSRHDDIPSRVLVFSKTEGYRHECIPVAIAALRKLCRDNGIAMDTTEDGADFNEKNLRRYNAVIFLNTTGDVLNPAQETDFERYIQAGGGYVGVHSSTDTEYGWTWYGGLAGGYFNGHPAQQNATLLVKDHDHPATKHLGDNWARFDEWYNFKNLNPNVKVLLSIDESSYQGGTNGADHPMSWCHEYDGGRAFYTALGHTKESYAEPEFLQHLLGGIKYAIGKKKRLNYTACRTPEQPDPTRFVKTVLASDLTEPMQFGMLPDGKVLLVERRGAIKLFDPATGLINVAYKLPVYSKEEDGLMWLAIDPNWEQNHWIYLYYSPATDESVNQLSRFVFVGDSLDRASEKIMLKVGVQREECCHAGGCLRYADDGYLYLSAGDNTNPFASAGYAPIDEIKGRSAWDAQKSSANTNDLRGKIMRIKPLADGSYVCPAGNLFNPQDLHITEGPLPNEQRVADNRQRGGRPEIYVMGCRNPFRTSIDARRNLLFWGEVGPDAGEPDSARGPAGHDEVNRARAAGFFGWPYFVGNNKPYRDYDFTTRKPGPAFDPLHPVNNSPNNTGARDLPPAQPAFIWYPYTNSPDFPLVGNGGRNAMAGPVYYCDQYPAEKRFPDYYDGKLITYDWMRSWMMAVTVDSMGNFSRMEPFGDSISLSRPMDMFVDKNGSLWVLEYGVQWFSSNPDARISRIDYIRGNRPPMPVLKPDRTAGATPCTVVFSAAQTRDYDDDRLSYEVDFGDGSAPWALREFRPAAYAGMKKVLKKNPLDSITHVFQQPGTYEVRLKVTDASGETKVTKHKIYAGNEPPLVRWDFGGKNRSFYQPGDNLNYNLIVEDREDGSLASGGITPAAVATTIDYLETGFDITSIAQGHQAAKQQTEYARGKTLIDRSDCKTCHAPDRQINGPAYQVIAERYRKDEFAVRNLSRKVITGGAGNWGQTVMSAHPQVSEEDAGEMVRWILSLGAPAKPKQSLPLSGVYSLALPAAKERNNQPKPGTFIFKASYKDRGSGSQSPLEEGETIALRAAFQQAEQADSMSKNIRTYRPFNGDTVVLNELKNNSFFVFKHSDLRGVHSVAIGIGSGDNLYKFSGGRLELRLDGPTGPLVGKVQVPSKNAAKRMEFSEIVLPLESRGDGKFHDLYFVVKNENNPSQPVVAVDWVRFDL